MKSASAAALAILSAGQYYKAELYDFIVGATTYRFTSSDAPITVGGNTYKTGLFIQRSGISQSVGLQVSSVELTVAPQSDNPGGTVLIQGIPILQAIRQGIFDTARVNIWFLFLTNWADTSPGAIQFVQGRINEVSAGRFSGMLHVNDDIEALNVAMPRNLIQTGCVHTLYDAGCTLLKSTFQVSGAVSGSPTIQQFNTGLTQVDNYFNLGVITFTSGVNNGVSRTVKTSANASGVVTLIYPLPQAPAAADTFTIVPGCPKTQAACSNNNTAIGPAFNNLAHFKGFPYVPMPETPYDGGAVNPQQITVETQIYQFPGSFLYGNLDNPGSYKP